MNREILYMGRFCIWKGL